MALNIRNTEAERLATELARQTGETKAEAVARALHERLARGLRDQQGQSLSAELEAITEHCASLPAFDTCSTEEILGYDDSGLPG